jgi:hypothetical protein
MTCGNDEDRARSCPEFTMNAPTLKPVIVAGNEDESPASSFRSIVRKSALLNLVIVLTSYPVLVAVGGPKAVVPTVAIMAGVTFLIWAATFTLFSFVSLGRTFWTAVSPGTRRKPPVPAKEAGVADRWLDGPG